MQSGHSDVRRTALPLVYLKERQEMTNLTSLGTFVQQSPHPSWLVHSNGQCLYANSALERFVGMNREQLKGIDWLELVAEEDRSGARVAWQQSRAYGLPFRVRVCLCSKAPDNRTPVELIALDNHTAEIGDFWLFTALHFHTSTHLHPPLEAQLQAALNIIPLPAWYATPEGAIVFVNQAAAAYFALPQRHPLRFGAEAGTTLESHLSFIHPDDQSHARKQWAACLRQYQIGDLQLRLLSGSGSFRWFLIRTEPLRTADGRLLCWIGVNIDMDEAKCADEALDQSERMRAMHVATIAELSTSISDEIVQPLSAVVVNARAALNWLTCDAPNVVRARAAIEDILRDGMSVGNVVHAMRERFKQ